MDADVASGLFSWSAPMSDADALDRIARSQAALAEGSAVDFAMLAAADDRLLGWIGLWREDEALALGYWLGARFHGQGLMTEALRLAIPAGRALLSEVPIIARVRPSNLASIRVLDRLGFAFARPADGELLEYRLAL